MKRKCKWTKEEFWGTQADSTQNTLSTFSQVEMSSFLKSKICIILSSDFNRCRLGHLNSWGLSWEYDMLVFQKDLFWHSDDWPRRTCYVTVPKVLFCYLENWPREAWFQTGSSKTLLMMLRPTTMILIFVPMLVLMMTPMLILAFVSVLVLMFMLTRMVI